jgi:CheY-like chemotaxis protein
MGGKDFGPLSQKGQVVTSPNWYKGVSKTRETSGMFNPLDIFSTEPDGTLLWRGAVESFAAAQRHIERLAFLSPGEYIILNQATGNKISIQPKTKRIVFQIDYEEIGMKARAELLRRFGHEVISVTHNEAAKVALSSHHDVDLFIVGHMAPEQTRREMVAWLKTNYPKVKIVALNPSGDQLPGADCNVTVNDQDEWLSLLAAAAS